jgi:outer membrane protein assembly factor BamB
MRALLTLVAVGIASGAAANPPAWPQFRGPGGRGVAPDDAKPPGRIGPDANVQWKIAVPSGFSSPVICEDRLFLTGFDRGKLLTIAYRLADGAELWRKEAPAARIEPFEKTSGGPAASTPATDGKRLVVYFGSYGLLCYDLGGKELWRHELPPGATLHGFGTGSSPVLVDGQVVLLRDLERDGRLVCLDLATGALRWDANRDGYKTSWGSACIWETPAGKQVVVAGGLRLKGYDLKTGKDLWTVTGLPSFPCTTPVVADGRLVYAGWSYGGDPELMSKMPKFDDLLKQAGEVRVGYLTRAGSEKTELKGYFDGLDPNKDGKITRQEWDAQVAYQASGRNVAFALKPGGTSDVTHSHVAWTATKGLPYIPSPLVYRGRMYVVNEPGRLSAYDVKTGKAVYDRKEFGLGQVYASPVAAGGHMYLCGLNGSVMVVRAGDDPVKESSASLDAEIAATPAVAGNIIYIRTKKSLYAFAEGK